MDRDRLTAAVEVRSSADGPRLYATVLTEGRCAASRRELFTPNSVVWPADGVAVLGEHYGAELARAVPTRESNGEIRIEVRASDAVRRLVDVEGRKHMSVEFLPIEERTTESGVREVLRAMVDRVALTANPDYDTTRAEVRERRRRRWRR